MNGWQREMAWARKKNTEDNIKRVVDVRPKVIVHHCSLLFIIVHRCSSLLHPCSAAPHERESEIANNHVSWGDGGDAECDLHGAYRQQGSSSNFVCGVIYVAPSASSTKLRPQSSLNCHKDGNSLRHRSTHRSAYSPPTPPSVEVNWYRLCAGRTSM